MIKLISGCTNPLWFVSKDTTLKELYEILDDLTIFGASKKEEREKLKHHFRALTKKV